MDRVVRADEPFSLPAEVIRRLSGLSEIDEEAKRVLRWVVGAVVYYVPGAGSAAFWSGRISRALLRVWEMDPTVRPAKSHEIPRAVAAGELLASNASAAELERLVRQRYGIFSLVLRQENTARKWTGDKQFTTPAEANARAGIDLVVASREELRRARRGDLSTIQELLTRPTDYWAPPVTGTEEEAFHA